MQLQPLFPHHLGCVLRHHRVCQREVQGEEKAAVKGSLGTVYGYGLVWHSHGALPAAEWDCSGNTENFFDVHTLEKVYEYETEVDTIVWLIVNINCCLVFRTVNPNSTSSVYTADLMSSLATLWFIQLWTLCCSPHVGGMNFGLTTFHLLWKKSPQIQSILSTLVCCWIQFTQHQACRVSSSSCVMHVWMGCSLNAPPHCDSTDQSVMPEELLW